MDQQTLENARFYAGNAVSNLEAIDADADGSQRGALEDVMDDLQTAIQLVTELWEDSDDA